MMQSVFLNLEVFAKSDEKINSFVSLVSVKIYIVLCYITLDVTAKL